MFPVVPQCFRGGRICRPVESLSGQLSSNFKAALEVQNRNTRKPEKTVLHRRDAEIFPSLWSVFTLNTDPCTIARSEKRDLWLKQRNVKLNQSDGVTGWWGSNQRVSASQQTNTDLWWQSSSLFMPLPFRLGKIRLLSCLCKCLHVRN